ncbi:sigma 54-interacting transcriptional regulator [Clostridium sp. SHJSY1]|uniref:sigma-54 interaction domain-containing protein n=1 Tax=Clostridium sp. SHJSY1 TaxID=2942483 RepID=UPI0028756F5C|nr:sigma 54-interacting transcriptional regulator [Clostridium sp. SHJSY1]MDS0525713.1 sigma 54-interacting transcriptional regulator [Clostridium sp. SHJSY1]
MHMKLFNEIETIKQQNDALVIVKNLIKEANSESDVSMVSSLNDVLDTIYTLKQLIIIANSIDYGVHIINSEGVVVYINDKFSKHTGFTKSIIGKSINELSNNNYIPDIAIKALKTKEIVTVRMRIKELNKIYSITANPIFDENKNPLGVIINDRDITNLIEVREKINIINVDFERLPKKVSNNIQKSMVGVSSKIGTIKQLVYQVAPYDTTVLITGATGTGKEIVANEIHKNSSRSEYSFIKINCSAIPKELIESELFGYEKGAFTGANSNGKPGVFELADKGTILLDEIGDMPLNLQAKLLRVLQEKEITRIGGTKTIKLNCRIIAATNCDIYKLAREGKFRMDLYYRLNVFPIELPTLKERKEDIKPLIEHYVSIFNEKYNKKFRIKEEQYLIFLSYDWPGNIRELQNIIERFTIISGVEGNVSTEIVSSILGINSISIDKPIGIKEKLEELEKIELIKALNIGKNTRKAAEILKISQSNVVRKAKKYDIKLYDA